MRDAELPGEAVTDGLSGRRPMEEALAGFGRQRNVVTMPRYEQTAFLCTLPPAAQVVQAFAVQAATAPE